MKAELGQLGFVLARKADLSDGASRSRMDLSQAAESGTKVELRSRRIPVVFVSVEQFRVTIEKLRWHLCGLGSHDSSA